MSSTVALLGYARYRERSPLLGLSGPCSGREAPYRMRFLADFITNIWGYRFSVNKSPLQAPRRTWVRSLKHGCRPEPHARPNAPRVMFDFDHAILIAGTLALSGVVLAAEAPTINLARWTAPDIAAVGDDPIGKLVKYGHAL